MLVAGLVFAVYLFAASVVVFLFWVLLIRFGSVDDLDPNSLLVRAVRKRHSDVGAAAGVVPSLSTEVVPELEQRAGLELEKGKSSVENEIAILQSAAYGKFYGGGYPDPLSTLRNEIAKNIERQQESGERYLEIFKAVKAALELHDLKRTGDIDLDVMPEDPFGPIDKKPGVAPLRNAAKSDISLIN